jgi:hypothetical protein
MQERGLAFLRPDFSQGSIIIFHVGTKGTSSGFGLQFSFRPPRYTPTVRGMAWLTYGSYLAVLEVS